MSANPPNQITINPNDPEQALALLNHVSRQISGTADLHDAIRQAISTLKGSIEDQQTWRRVSQGKGESEMLTLLDLGIAGKMLAIQGIRPGKLVAEDRRSENEQPEGNSETSSIDRLEPIPDRNAGAPIPDSGSGNPGYFDFDCPIHGRSRIPLPPAGETFTPACLKCIEAEIGPLGICAKHPEKRFHPREESCETWLCPADLSEKRV